MAGRIGLNCRNQLLSALTAAGVRDILAEGIRDVRSKKITPRTAGAIAQLCNPLLRVLPIADLEARLAKLEQQLAEQESRRSVHTDPTRSRKCAESCGGTDAQPDDVDAKESGDGEEGGSDGSDEGGKA